MNLTIENILLVGSILLFLSLIAGKTSYRFGVPTLLLFLGVGMLSGSEGIGGIRFDNPRTAQFIGIIALNFILFSGGLDTNWKSVRPVLGQGIVLSTLGVLLTAVTLGTFIYYIFPLSGISLSFNESMLLGSIVSSTDAAAVFSILRSKNLLLKTNLKPTLEFESGSNDPMAYVLTISFLSLVQFPEMNEWLVILMFFKQMLIGGIAGFILGKLSEVTINRIKLDFEGMYPVLMIALMFFIFSATDFIGGNGFLAIYIAGVFLGNKELTYKQTILSVYDGLAWLMQIVLFLTLGLLVFPNQVYDVMGIGLLISLFLIFIARPLSVLISLAPFKMKRRRRMYISWVGLRGAVPIVFATYPLIAGIENANLIFNIVFFISLTSIIIQGTSLPIVAKWLDVTLPQNFSPVLAEVNEKIAATPSSTLQEVDILPEYYAVGKKIGELKFPGSTFIVVIKRNGEYIRPGGSTVINAKDRLMIYTNNMADYKKVKSCMKNANSNFEETAA
ncbi:MAG: potassium/proton antiporter [Bacteroidetes bacterium]|nr:potassium/proton antiporter [Bacteroidota bacterium]